MLCNEKHDSLVYNKPLYGDRLLFTAIFRNNELRFKESFINKLDDSYNKVEYHIKIKIKHDLLLGCIEKLQTLLFISYSLIIQL